MGTGEHYFVDLVVAAPFTLFFYAIFCAEISWCDHKRWAAILGRMAMVLTWFALLRHEPHLFWNSPAIPWAMVVVTVVGTLWLKRSLSAISVDAGCEEHEAPIADVPAEGPESVRAH
jgi:hypothetical protein